MFGKGQAGNNSKNSILLGYHVQTSLYGSVIPILYGQARLPGNVIWTGDWRANPASGKGKSGAAKGKSGSATQYTYSSAVALGICQGPIYAIRTIWIDKTKLASAISTESHSGAGNYTVANHTNFLYDVGVTSTQAYSVTHNDYGSPGSVTSSGSQTVPLVATDSGSPGPGQYHVDGAGVYTFNGADSGTLQITYVYSITTSSDTGGPINTLKLTQFKGGIGQTPWGYLTTNHPDQNIGYSELAYVANSKADLGAAGVFPNLSLEVAGLLQFPGHTVDAEPSAIIADFTTNPYLGQPALNGDYGAMFPAANLGSMAEMRNYCVANGLFISPLLDSQQTAATWIQQWCDIANCAPVWSEGLLKFRCYGDTTVVGNGATYSPAQNVQPIYDFDDDDFIGEFTLARPSVRDAENSISIEWSNRANDYNAEPLQERDDAAITLYGLRPATQKTLHAIRTQPVAALVANTMLKRSVYIRNRYTFQVGYQYILLEPMDLVTVTNVYQGLIKAPVRITQIDEDENGLLTLTCEDFPWGTATATLYSKQVTGSFGPGYFADPGFVHTPQFFEEPPVIANGVGFVLLIALSGGQNWGGCDVYVSPDNTTYEQIGTQRGESTQGTLATALPIGLDPDTVNLPSVDLTISSGALATVSKDDADNGLSICIIDQEIIGFETATLTAPNTYTLSYLRRGMFGSTITSHLVGAQFMFYDAKLFSWDYTAQDVGQNRYFKFLSFNEAAQQTQSLAQVTPYLYRIETPRPPYPWAPQSQVNGAVANTFGLQQDPDALAAGLGQLLITGPPPVNQFSSTTQPPQITLTTATTGGAIPAGSTAVIGVTAVGADGLETQMRVAEIDIPAGTNTNKVTIAVTFYDPANDSGKVYVGTIEAAGLRQNTVIHQGLVTKDVLGLSGGSGAPDAEFDYLTAQAAREYHGGIWGGPVTSVSAAGSPSVLTFAGGAWTTGDLVNHTLVMLSKADNSPLPFLAAVITANDASTITLDQDWSISIAAGDVVEIRTLADTFSATTLGDSKFINGGPGQPGTGLVAHDSAGNLVWIIAGTGAGQRRTIADNTATVYTVGTPFNPAPDATSVFIELEPTWSFFASSQEILSSALNDITFALPVDSSQGQVYVVQVLTTAADGSESAFEYSPFREIYQPAIAPGIAGLNRVGNPTIVSASYTYSAADTQGVVSVLMRVIYTPPADAKFVGVHGYIEAPDISSTPQSKLDTGALDTASLSPAEPRIDEGQIPYHAADLDANGNITVTLPGIPSPTAAENWRVYLAPYADSFEPPFVAANLASPTPSIVIAVNPPGTTGTGTEYAPLVSALALGVVETRYFQSHWEWRATITWVDPADLSSFGGVDIVLVNTTVGDPAYGLQAERDRVAPGQGSLTFNWLPLPDTIETFKVEALSVDRNGNSNSFNVAITPGLDISTPALPGVGNVTGFTLAQMYGINPFDGSPALILDPTFDPPLGADGDPDPQFAYCEFRVHIIEPNIWTVLGDPGRSHDAAYVDQQFYPDTAQTWVLYLVSVDSNGKLKYGQSDITNVGDSPSVTITVQPPVGINGAEYAFPILGETCTIVYKIGADGIETYSFSGTVTPPVDDRYQGVRIVAVPAGEAGIIITELGPNDTTFQTDFWPVSSTTGVTFAVYFLSFDSSGHYNTFVNGFTPEISGIVVTAQTPGKLNPTRLDTSKLASALGIVGGKLDILQLDLGKAIASSVGTALAVTSGVLHVPPNGITAALVAAYAVGNNHFDRASANKIAIVDADIVNLSAAKINVGTLGAGVIYAGSITANQVTAGTLTGVVLNLIKGGITTIIDTTSYFGYSTRGMSMFNNSTGDGVSICTNDIVFTGRTSGGASSTAGVITIHGGNSAVFSTSFISVDGKITGNLVVANGNMECQAMFFSQSTQFSATAGSSALPANPLGFFLVYFGRGLGPGGSDLVGKIPFYGV